VFNKNCIILHLIECYRHSQLLPSVTLDNCGTFFVPAFLLSSIQSVTHFNMKTTGGDETIVNNYPIFLTAAHKSFSEMSRRQGWTNPGIHVATATKFFSLAPNICEYSDETCFLSLCRRPEVLGNSCTPEQMVLKHDIHILKYRNVFILFIPVLQ
jgi:hypothetical protein